MSNLNDPSETTADGIRVVRIAERARAEHLGASLYEVKPSEEMVFADAVADYGGKATLVPPAPGPRQMSGS
jgi:hypothetical protein